MIENLPVKIDEAGRIVVPTKIRKKYNIQKNDLLILKTNENSFQLIKDDQEKN